MFYNLGACTPRKPGLSREASNNFSASGSASYSNATSLLQSLFTNYENSLVPACDDLPTVQVEIGLAVRQIIELVSRVDQTSCFYFENSQEKTNYLGF